LKIGTRNEAGNPWVLYSRKSQLMLYSLACVTRLDEQAWRNISHQKTRAKATASEALRLSSLPLSLLPAIVVVRGGAGPCETTGCCWLLDTAGLESHRTWISPQLDGRLWWPFETGLPGVHPPGPVRGNRVGTWNYM
jgi:hypothetical protein